MALLRIDPNEFNFHFELNKKISCSIQLTNTTDGNVAFKMKTTSPKKYVVRPNADMLSANDSIVIVVTMQAQQAAPPDMQCKDKFLVQSTIVPSKDFSQDVFNKESGNEVFTAKLRVHFVQPVLPHSALHEAEEEELRLRTLPESGNGIEHASMWMKVVSKRGTGDTMKGQSGFSFCFMLLVCLVWVSASFLWVTLLQPSEI